MAIVRSRDCLALTHHVFVRGVIDEFGRRGRSLEIGFVRASRNIDLLGFGKPVRLLTPLGVEGLRCGCCRWKSRSQLEV